MRRLFWLVLGIGLAWYGFGLVAGGDSFATYRLRDGLLVALVGALFFAWNTGPFPAQTLIGGERNWPLWGRILFGTGFVCGMAATLLLTLWGEQSWAVYLGGSLWAMGALALLVGLFWPGRVEIYPAPAFRWRVDAAGNYVRYALDDPSQPVEATPFLRTWQHPFYLILLVILLGTGVLLRVWCLTTLPPTCIDVECALALRLVEGSWPQGFGAEALSLFALLARLIYNISGESVSSLRWSGALLGSLTLPVIYWAARAYLRPAGALVTLLVTALLSWSVWSSRYGTVWSVAPLLLALVLGMAGRALLRPSHRWWGLTGVTLGLLLMQPLPLWGATLGWLVVLAGAALWAQAQMPGQSEGGIRRAFIDHAAVMIGCALAIGLPLALPIWRVSLVSAPVDGNSSAFGPLALAAGLLDGGAATLDYFVHRPLLPAWAAALTMAGLATWLRWARQPWVAVVALGMLLYGVALFIVIPPMVAAGLVAATTPATLLTLPIVSSAEAWLPLLPFMALAIGVAADQLFTAFDRAWSLLLPLPRIVVAAALVLALLAGGETLALMGQLDRSGGTAQNETEVAIGQYLARCLRGEEVDDPCSQHGENAPIFYVPPTALTHPATRLLLGSAQESGRVLPFDPGRDLLPPITPTGDLYYLVSLTNQPIIELLRQLYPNAQLHAEPTDQAGPTLFLVIQIPLTDLLSHQGLAGLYYSGLESTGNAAVTRMDGPLHFAWGSAPPLRGPFNVLWEGSLLVRSGGAYEFAIDAGPSDPASATDAPVISLQLDGNLVLDSSLGLTEKTEMLAEGAYQLALRYRTNASPDDWSLRWTPPGGQPQEIPRHQLYSPALPNIGLVGTYFAGSNWGGATLTQRKDMVLDTPVDLPIPFSVQWTGQLSAARAGEYFFAVTANGPVTLMLDGHEAMNYLPPIDLADGPDYSQVSLYLEKGWHPIELRYAPADRSDLRILWQPPGSGPMLLAGRHLLPTLAPLSPSDLPLPAVDLLDARLGDDNFALSANLEPYQPVPNQPPSLLPQLVAEPAWTVANGCGADNWQFASPRGVALDAATGRVYVADTENRRVVELDLADGAHVTAYALPDFQEPVDVAIDPQGALLVLDAMVQNIFRIDRATGESAPLALGASFYRPRGFAVDWAGNIAVADTGGARVVVLDGTGAFLTQFGGLETGLGQGQPVDVLALGDQLWAIAADHGRLWRLDVMGSLAISPRTDTLTGPQLAGLPDGSGFFLSDPVRRTVLYFAPNGRPVGQLGYADTFINPMGVAATFGVGGIVNLVVSDSDACTVSLWQLRRE